MDNLKKESKEKEIPHASSPKMGLEKPFQVQKTDLKKFASSPKMGLEKPFQVQKTDLKPNRLTSLFLIFLLSLSLHAQTPRPAYCEITTVNASLFGTGKDRVVIDLGAERKGTLVDDRGKPLKFNSHIDVLNHMSLLGWKVVQTYFYNDDVSKQKVLRFLMEKQVTEDSQIQDGIFIKVPEKYTPGKSGDDMY